MPGLQRTQQQLCVLPRSLPANDFQFTCRLAAGRRSRAPLIGSNSGGASIPCLAGAGGGGEKRGGGGA